MPDKNSVDAYIKIYVPIERVWEALTEPNQIKQYFFGTETETDWQVGHPIVWRGEWEGKKYEDKGEVLVYDKPTRLSFSHFSPMTGDEDKPENYHHVSFELDGHDDHTHVYVTQANFKSKAEQEHSAKNWQMVLEGLKKLVEA